MLTKLRMVTEIRCRAAVRSDRTKAAATAFQGGLAWSRSPGPVVCDLQGARARADGLLIRRDLERAQAGEIDDPLDAEAAQDRLAVRGLDVPQVKHVQNLQGSWRQVVVKGRLWQKNKCTRTKTY